MKKYLLLLISICISVLSVQAQNYVFDFNEQCDKAYEKIMSFKVVEGLNILKEEQKRNPNNLIPYYIENYDDFIVLMFNGDEQEYARRKKNLDIRISKMSKGNKKDPWFNFTKANMYFQWATIKIRFGDYVSAANDFRKSYQLIKSNKGLFPNFKYNNIIYGIEETIVGTVPDKFKWITGALGMKGDVKKGNAKLVEFLNTRDETAKHLRIEAIFYYVYVNYTLIADHEGIWSYLEQSQIDYKNNHLYTFMKANVALSINKAAEAERILRNRSNGSQYLQAPLLDYFHGVSLFYNNKEQCISYFEKFLKHSKGKLYEKDAYQKMSLYYFVNDDLTLADKYKSAILTRGSGLIEADKQADRYAKSTTTLNKDLILSRMYADGGYLTQSVQVLDKINNESLSDLAQKIEYQYRYARVFSIQKKWDKAIPYYLETIKIGSNRPEHFAARSCLELGEIYEKKGQKATAVSYYKKCLAMKNHDYKSSLDQKAKAGINRLGQS